MITFLTGNIFDSTADALVNPVNCLGVAGKGLAREFKKRYPTAHAEYADRCKRNLLRPGSLVVAANQKPVIIFFPTKVEWWEPSQLVYISEGLLSLCYHMRFHIQKIKSIAIPALGCGEGGLEWGKVKPLMENCLSDLPITVFIYEPK